jgi:hypothetical protein
MAVPGCRRGENAEAAGSWKAERKEHQRFTRLAPHVERSGRKGLVERKEHQRFTWLAPHVERSGR